MKDIEKAKEYLKADDKITLVFVKNETVIKSKKRGVMPLIEAYESGVDYSGFSVADKVVGKGAAFLYEMLNVSCVFARVISRPALELLTANRIEVSYEILTDRIENRTKTGFCPIESAVVEENDAQSAYKIIKKTLNNLK